MTAQWWPWFTFTLQQRIPATAFTPRPSVDGGLLVIRRRSHPLVDNQHDYQRWVKTVFSAAGRGLPQILTRAGGIPAPAVGAWCRREGLTSQSLPKDLSAEQWASSYTMTKTVRSPGAHHRPSLGGSR